MKGPTVVKSVANDNSLQRLKKVVEKMDGSNGWRILELVFVEFKVPMRNGALILTKSLFLVNDKKTLSRT